LSNSKSASKTAKKSVSKSNVSATPLKRRRINAKPVISDAPPVRSLKSRRIAAVRASKSASKNQGFQSIFKGLFKRISASPMNAAIAIGIIAIYAIIRFGMTRKLDAMGAYASYVFELGLVVMAAIYYRKRIRLQIDRIQEVLLSFAPGLVGGTLIYLGLKPLGIAAPFEMRTFEPILLLVLVGPILEELIFRFTLWNPLLDLSRKGRGGVRSTLIVTSLLFAYAHLHVIWFVGPELRAFIAYQTIYVLALAAYCGWRLIRTGSILSPIVVHIGFNLGFFLGSFL
jgi:membrane protease YdiL (CAAX protease family)